MSEAIKNTDNEVDRYKHETNYIMQRMCEI